MRYWKLAASTALTLLILSSERRTLAQDEIRTVYGDRMMDYFGGEVSGVGDVNHDGYDDFLVAALGHDGNGPASGKGFRLTRGRRASQPHLKDTEVSMPASCPLRHRQIISAFAKLLNKCAESTPPSGDTFNIWT